MPPLTKGLFITFEGIDGSGKSTQMQHSEAWLIEQGYSVLPTRNPGGTDMGQQIRQILLHQEGFVSSTAELLLYMADRAQHLEELVLPAVKKGKVVLCDRYSDSSIAYQGYGRDLSVDMIEQLDKIATQGTVPDLTFLFVGPVEVLLTRVQKRGEKDRLEKESVAFFERVQQGYQALASRYPDRFCVLDATQPPEVLTQQVQVQLQKLLTTIVSVV